MNNSTVNFTTPETSTTQLMGLEEYQEICAYSVNLLFGLPIHSYIIWLIVMKTGGGVASEFFLLNLSVCEIGICLDGLVVLLSFWDDFFSIIYYFLIGLFVTGRPLFQCLICVERYLAVFHPVTFLKYKPLRYRAICCAAAWIFILGFCLVCMYTLSLNQKRTNAWIISVQLILVVSIQLFCLVSVLRALKQSGPGEKKREEENHTKKRAFYLILITTISMIILYLPFLTAGISVIVTPYGPSTGWFVSLICFILTGFTQPFLYLCRNGKLSCLCSL